MDTWTDRFKRGQGVTVGTLKPGDIFRIGNLPEHWAEDRCRGGVKANDKEQPK